MIPLSFLLYSGEMTKGKRDPNSEGDSSVTDSKNDLLSESGEVGGFESGDELSSNEGGSSPGGDSNQPLAWNIPLGRPWFIRRGQRRSPQ